MMRMFFSLSGVNKWCGNIFGLDPAGCSHYGNISCCFNNDWLRNRVCSHMSVGEVSLKYISLIYWLHLYLSIFCFYGKKQKGKWWQLSLLLIVLNGQMISPHIDHRHLN